MLNIKNTKAFKFVNVADNPVHHSPYIRQLMQEEFQSKKVHLSQDNTATNNQTIPDSVTEEQADSVSSKSHSMIEQESVTTGSDVKAEIVRTLTDHNNQAEDKHLTDKSDHVDCSGDAKATDSNIPKSSQKEKEAKQPSKEDTIGKSMVDNCVYHIFLDTKFVRYCDLI